MDVSKSNLEEEYPLLSMRLPGRPMVGMEVSNLHIISSMCVFAYYEPHEI